MPKSVPFIFFGMGLQAAITSLLLYNGVIQATYIQQGIASILLFISCFTLSLAVMLFRKM